jgi:LysM repeat protein
MASLKRGAMVASILVLVSIIASACNQPYSQPPSVTNTPINPDSLFATPMGGPTNMSDVQNFATGTSLALTGTPASVLITQTPGGGVTQTASSTPLVPLNPTSTATATLAVSGTQPTALPPGSRPSTHALQKGEFPYCIARRFDVNPQELLNLNRLASGNLYYANLTLQIPQTGNPFPPPRSLKPHPATYTVVSSDQTVAGVACLFGDVYPSAIAQASGISESATLTAGQVLTIP